MLKAIVSLSLLFTSQIAFAQDGSSFTKIERSSSNPVSVLLLGDAFILNGAGLKATYKVSNKLSVGALGKIYKLKNDDTGTSSKWITNSVVEITNYGLVADFFPMASNDQRGLYISGAVTSVHAKTKVDDTFFGSGGSEDDRIGAQVTVGYQLVMNTAHMAKILFQVGAGYGNGGGVEYKVFTGKDTKIREALILDLTAGVRF